MRQALCRAIRVSHKFNITTDSAFQSSTVVFNNRLKDLKKAGFGAVDHHPDITKVDLQKVVDKLSPDVPEELQYLVWLTQSLLCPYSTLQISRTADSGT